MTIKAPLRAAHHPDRGIDAEEALEPSLLAMVEIAEAAGWKRAEIWPALISVATNHIRADLENDRLQAALRTHRVRRLIWPNGD